MRFDLGTRRIGAAALGLTMFGATAVTLIANPVTAAGIVTAVTTVSCSVTGANWCISGNNTSSGVGVSGTSKSGIGLRGASTSQYGLKATSVSGMAILAQTTSGSIAISATAGNGVGVFGDGSTGVFGASKTGPGVLGQSYGAGVVGNSVGNSSTSTGVRGFASSGYGGYFASDSGYGAFANTTGGVAFVGRTANENASDIQGSHIGLLGRAPTNGFPLVGTDANANTVFYVDGVGNVGYSGNLSPLASTIGGGKAHSFSPKSTSPTIEDTGTAQLVSGIAVVRLDSTFAASIDPTTAYRVFVTPAGDTRGLFVASRTTAGFIVRESQAGRSTVTFDYRIVATALGQTGQRMARINPATDALTPKAPLLMLPTAAVVPSLKFPASPPATP